MEQRINIAALLKDCPQGTKLYSPICGECELYIVDIVDKKLPVHVIFDDRHNIYLSPYGKYFYNGGECLLFPSKEVRDWGMFNVKYSWGGDGIIGGEKVKKLLVDNGGTDPEDGVFDCSDSMAVYYIDAVTHEINVPRTVFEKDYILMTGTELKIEEVQPKFEVGDVIKYCNSLFIIINDGTETKGQELNISSALRYFKESAIATPEEIAKWNKETLEPKHLHYSKSRRKIIDWFKEFDRVVVRTLSHTEKTKWYSRQFDYSYFDEEVNLQQYACQDGISYDFCLPYNEKTAKLIGTTDDWVEE